MNKSQCQNSIIEVYEVQPANFKPIVHVAACYIEIDHRLLLLQRTTSKFDGERWGVPGGKLEVNETPDQGACRELLEETGIEIDLKKHLQSLGALYMRKPDIDYVFHMFKVTLENMPEVTISDEHLSYAWATLQEIKDLDMMTGAYEALRIYYQRSLNRARSGASVNAYLILRKKDQVLLLLRKNTGYYDGFYGLVAGHVEDGESATSAMIREAKEEAGIHLTAGDLKVVHVLHRNTDRLNVDIFFECTSWQGPVTNMEPEKCGGLQYYAQDKLPENTMDYIADVLKSVEKGVSYSEDGWRK